jgi:surface antigen
MSFQSGEHAPLRRVSLRGLPSLAQQDFNPSSDGSDTTAFRAALRGLDPDEEPEALDEEPETAERMTVPLPGSVLSPPKPARMGWPLREMSRRRMLVTAVALLVLLGVAASLVGALAFGADANPKTVVPTPPKASGAQAGIVSVATPTAAASPTPTPTPKPILPPPTPTPPPWSTNGPYANNIPPPGYTSYAVTEPSPDPWASSFGQCTWWAQYKRQDENFLGMGAAKNWAVDSRARGYTVSSTPAANATVVFAPGEQGASSAGHVAHVEQVLTGGWVLVSEMNFYWNGGGWGRVDYRYIHIDTGVWFIY